MPARIFYGLYIQKLTCYILTPSSVKIQGKKVVVFLKWWQWWCTTPVNFTHCCMVLPTVFVIFFFLSSNFSTCGEDISRNQIREYEYASRPYYEFVQAQDSLFKNKVRRNAGFFADRKQKGWIERIYGNDWARKGGVTFKSLKIVKVALYRITSCTRLMFFFFHLKQQTSEGFVWGWKFAEQENIVKALAWV